MRRDFALAENYIAFQSGRIRFLNDKINGILFKSTGRSLSCWLVENAEKTDGIYCVDLQTSYSRLAEILNMGRASLYHSFDELERAGLIEREGKRIAMPDPDKLLSY